MSLSRARRLAFALVCAAAVVFALAGGRWVLARAGAWAALLLVSFVGWGTAVEWTVLRTRRVGWATRAVWGMSAVVALGGALCLMHLARRPVALGVVLAGVGLACYGGAASSGESGVPRHLSRRVASVLSDPAWAVRLALWGLLGLLLLRCAGALAETSLHPFDDVLAYAVHPRMILDTGTLMDPFSVRRMSSYGGQSYLLSLLLAGDDGTHLKVLDGGLALLILGALVVQHVRGRPPAVRVAGVLVLALLLTMPAARFNLAPLLTGAPFFFVILTRLALQDRPGGWRGAVLLALPAAALATLRQSYLVPVAALLAASYGLAMSRRDAPRRSLLAELAWTAGLSVAVLSPWAILAWLSNGTPLFPVIRGHLNAAYEPLSAHGGGGVSWPFVRGVLVHGEPILPLSLVLLGAVALACSEESRRKPVCAMLFACVAGYAAILVGFPLSDAPNISRYVLAFLLPLAMIVPLAAADAVAVAATGRDGRNGRNARNLVSAGLAAVALLVQLHQHRGDVRKGFVAQVASIARATRLRLPCERAGAPLDALQRVVPAGAGMAVMIDDPRGLDFRRNRIALLDLPGAASPPPGMPLGHGASALSDYLVGQGFRYAAFVRPSLLDDGLYRRHRWARHLVTGELIWKLSAPYYLALFSDIEALDRERPHLYDDGRLFLVELAGR